MNPMLSHSLELFWQYYGQMPQKQTTWVSLTIEYYSLCLQWIYSTLLSDSILYIYIYICSCILCGTQKQECKKRRTIFLQLLRIFIIFHRVFCCTVDVNINRWPMPSCTLCMKISVSSPRPSEVMSWQNVGEVESKFIWFQYVSIPFGH